MDVIDGPAPEPPPGWARLTVAACGICGSDLHGFRHGSGGQAGHQPGHEADKLAPVVTHRFGLGDVNRAFETALDKGTGSIKVQISPLL